MPVGKFGGVTTFGDWVSRLVEMSRLPSHVWSKESETGAERQQPASTEEMREKEGQQEVQKELHWYWRGPW